MKLKGLMLLCFFMVTLVACSRKENGSQITIRYSAPSFIKYNAIREKVGKEFEKKMPGVKMVYEPIPSSMFFDKLMTQMASETEPDVFFMRDFELPTFVEKDAITNLDQFIRNDPQFNLKDYHKILIDSYTVNHKLYGLPGSFTSGVIFYNKSLLAKAGLEPMNDLSWEKLVSVGKQLTLKDAKNQGITTQFGIVMEYNDWITFILQNNGKIFSRDKKKCILYSGYKTQAVGAIEFLKSLIKKHHIMPSMSDLQQGEPYQMFMLNRAALFTGGRWYTAIFNDIKSFSWGIMPFFYHKKKSVRLDSHSWVISKHSKNPKMAWEFLKFLTSNDSNWKLVQEGDSVPVHRSNVEKFIQLNPENKVFIDALSYAYTVDNIMTPYVPWRQMQNTMNQEFDKFLMDQQSADKTLKNIEEWINTQIQEKLMQKTKK